MKLLATLENSGVNNSIQDYANYARKLLKNMRNSIYAKEKKVKT